MAAQVRIGKKRSRGIAGAKNPTVPGFKNIDATSGSNNKLNGRLVKHDFSPLLIGPITSGKQTAQIFENYWQYSKVYPDLGHLSHQSDDETDLKKIDFHVSQKWYKFREAGYAKAKGIRHPPQTRSNEVAYIDRFGRNRYRYYLPEFAIYDLGNGDVKLGYLESRKKVYVPLYDTYIRETESFMELQEMVEQGVNIQILDLDGPRDGDLGDDRQSHLVTLELLRKKINDVSAPFGHGYVLAAALAGFSPADYC